MQNNASIESKPVILNRLSWTDYAKGIAIMLVVFRHVAVGLRRSSIDVSDWIYNIQEFCYNFWMPAFFILSGLFAARSFNKQGGKTLLAGRSQTLLYPYLLWAVAITMLQIFFSGYTNSQRSWNDLLNILVQPRKVDHLWYLLALFNTVVIYVGLNSIPFFRNNRSVQIVLALAMHIVSHIPLIRSCSLISDAFYFYLFFLAGALLSSFFFDQRKSEKMLSSKRLLFVLPVFVAGQIFWFFNKQDESSHILLFLLINFVACYFVYLVSYRLSKWKASGWLAYLGTYSLYIYILHVPVAAVIRNVFIHVKMPVPAELVFVACWVGGLLLPILLYNLFRNVGFRKLFSLKTERAR